MGYNTSKGTTMNNLRDLVAKIEKMATSPEGIKRVAEFKEYDNVIKTSWTSQLPKKFGDNFDAGRIDENRVCGMVKRYVNDKAWEQNKWAVVMGKKSGEGKSHDIAWLISKMPNRSLMWAITPQDIISAYFENEYIYNGWRDVRILVIDDMDHCNTGKQEEGGERREIIHNLISYRDLNKKITFITANCGMDGLEKVWSQYVVRRICENSEGYREIK